MALNLQSCGLSKRQIPGDRQLKSPDRKLQTTGSEAPTKAITIKLHIWILVFN